MLVVDDQEQVRALLRRQLTRQGHTVLEAGDGDEALYLVRRRQGDVDLVLSDVVMGQMNGTELATKLCTEFPGLPIILMSAYAPAGLARVGYGEHVVPVLQKPFEPDQLKQLVELAIRRPGPKPRSARQSALS